MKKISVDKALKLISSGEPLENYDVTINKPVDAIKAFHLRKNGISVPDNLISYDDSDLIYDEDFDEGEWVKIPASVNENIYELTYGLSLTEDEIKWLKDKDVEISTLLSQLLRSYIQTDQLITKLDSTKKKEK